MTLDRLHKCFHYRSVQACLQLAGKVYDSLARSNQHKNIDTELNVHCTITNGKIRHF